ncbi:hypothetical protein GCM10009753_65700 [Streptantibioticus ferralitis]
MCVNTGTVPVALSLTGLSAGGAGAAGNGCRPHFCHAAASAVAPDGALSGVLLLAAGAEEAGAGPDPPQPLTAATSAIAPASAP